jgi:hypothetical protein
MSEKLQRPYSDLLTREMYFIVEAPVAADANGYANGDLLTYDGEVFSKASLASGTDHTESMAVVYEPIEANATKGVIVLFGGVRENMLSDAYQALTDDDKKAVKKELLKQNIIVENI